jgi:hypothetical protein
MIDGTVEFKLAKEENRMNGMKTGAPEITVSNRDRLQKNPSTENNR